MFAMRRITIICIVAATGWFAYRGGFTAIWNAVEPMLSTAALPIALIGCAALVLGGAALFLSRQRARRNRAHNDDALRMLRQQQQRQSSAQNADQALQQLQPNIAETSTLAPDTLALPANDQNRGRPRRFVMNEPAIVKRVSDGVYFEPLVHVPSGEVVGFDMRRQLVSDRNTVSFEHYATHLSNAEQAKLEADGLKQTSSEARRVIGRNFRDQSVMIDVPVSSALLADRRRLQSIINLMNAHPTLKRSIRLLVDARALHKPQKALLDAVKAFDREAISMALNLSAPDQRHFAQEHLARFDAVYISKSLLQQAAMSRQAETVNQNGTGASKQSTFDLLETLAQARDRNLEIVATGVVCEPDVVDMLAEGIETMSGSLFGEPRAVKPELLNKPAEPAKSLDRAG